MDTLFTVTVLNQSPNPQQTIYAGMHQGYAEGFVSDDREVWPSEARCGQIVVDNLLKGGRGHYGPLEHPQMALNVGWFPHSTMQQMRTHRLTSFDVQSFRYTGQRILDVANGDRDVDEVFYLRPTGHYTDRQGKRYTYTQEERDRDMNYCWMAAKRYRDKIALGYSEEHARGLIPFDVRQHWVMSANLRSWLHLLDLRSKLDAQLECQHLCELIWPHIQAWVPDIAYWYQHNRLHKARLSP